MRLHSITVWPLDVKPAGPLTDEEEVRIAAVMRERYADSGWWGPRIKSSRHAPDQGVEETQ